MATSEPHTTRLRTEDLQPLLDGRYGSLRRQIRDALGGADLIPPVAIPTAEYPELVVTWMRAFAANGVTREVNRLCDQVRGDAEALVDASGIPDGVLRAPIAVR